MRHGALVAVLVGRVTKEYCWMWKRVLGAGLVAAREALWAREH